MKKFTLSLIFIFLTLQSVFANSSIVINEIMYNSDGVDVEFIELYNASESTQDLQNWYLLDDNDEHQHCVINWTLNPGEYLVVAADISQFSSSYSGVSNINPNDFDKGGNGWSFGNGGDVVRLFDSSNNLHDIVDYNDGGAWPGSPDGNGPSLELMNPNSDNTNPTSWDPSSVTGGTPGEQNSVYTENTTPTCKNGDRSIGLPTNSDKVIITVTAFDAEDLSHVDLYVNNGQGYSAQTMFDDGTNEDAVAGDSIFTAIINEQSDGTLVKYYAKASDNIGQEDKWPNDAPVEYHAYTVGYETPDLRITELIAINNSVNTDEHGDYDDWFEIYNAGSENVNLNGMFVSNSLGSSKSYQLPNKILTSGEYLLLWADSETEQGDFHVTFKFSSSGEEIALFETVDHGNVLIHGWKYGRMNANVSMGLKPVNGNAPEYLVSPTPGASNESSELYSPVCINEFQTTSGLGGVDDWIEIYNRGSEAYDLAGCFLSDQRGNNTKWNFPTGPVSVIEPGEFITVHEDVLGFGLSSKGNDLIMLTMPDSLTGLDFYDFGQQEPDKSEGRFPDGVGVWQFFDEPTKGNSNNSTEIDKDVNTTTDKFTLFQNYPNPFNPTTVIKYTLTSTEHVKINVYDIKGEIVSKLVNQNMSAGIYTVNFDASHLTSGAYFYKISAGNHSKIRKMMLIK